VNHDRCCLFRPTKNVITGPDSPPVDMPGWSTNANLHLDMNPWDWMGDGEKNRAALAELRYDRLNNFIFENNQPSHVDGTQLQGVLNLADNRVEDGGFICAPGFPKYFDRYFRELKPNSNASFNFKPKDQVTGLGIRIAMRAGSMVVWDQKMAHGSLPNRSDRFRSAQFIKLFPRRTVSPERGMARAATLWEQIKNCGFEGEVTPLGRMLFGLDALPH